MNRIILVGLFILLFVLSVFAFAQDRVLDVGTMKPDKNLHQAIYSVLKNKGISCSGLRTSKDTNEVIVIGASAETPLISGAEIKVQLDKIKLDREIKEKIENKIRQLAIDKLKAEGQIPQDYRE